ncbi:MAG: hypothetical protein FWG72_06200 [Oscillospiraceae bacterium]|nr:hypothetical protein [Oscillospiraceae bacterium]
MELTDETLRGSIHIALPDDSEIKKLLMNYWDARNALVHYFKRENACVMLNAQENPSADGHTP